MTEQEIHLSSGWRRSGHKFWVQISILSIKPGRAAPVLVKSPHHAEGAPSLS
jgi:hypothetical protein